jgi:hypothetical protein
MTHSANRQPPTRKKHDPSRIHLTACSKSYVKLTESGGQVAFLDGAAEATRLERSGTATQPLPMPGQGMVPLAAQP